MKRFFLLTILFIISHRLAAQQNYCDFEGIKVIHFGDCTGIIDSAHINPGMDAVNSSPLCLKYIRDTALYDNIRIYPDTKLTDVTPYANNSFSTPKIRIKVYSSAPVGSPIQIQLGTKLDNTYPGGVHSEYYAVTTIQNAWQVVTFNFQQIPAGSMTGPLDIDKIVILFRPNTSGRDTIYMDDITGPQLLTNGINKEEQPFAKLFQNTPNPAKETSHINFQLNIPGTVSLKIFDIVGNTIVTLLNDNMKPGTYSVPVETTTMPNGVYFYTLQVGSMKRSMKMIVSN